MAIFDKFLNSVRLVDDEDYDDDYEYEDDYDEEEETGKKRFFGFGRKKKEEIEDEIDDEPTKSKLTPMRGGKTSHRMEVRVVRPVKFDDVQEIADALLSNRTIILNIEGLNREDAQRIIDFMTGACYSIDGNIRMISRFIFIITPSAVDISGDISGLMDAFESSSSSIGSMGSISSMRAVNGVSAY